ncbi:MAG: peptidase S41 [Bacteroidetes bacterium]|nr:MAG: peptidase S41 [Bacteroidota bacterium]
MNFFRQLSILLAFSFLLMNCEKALIQTVYSNTPTDNFEAMWTEFNQLYGLFEVRDIDWQAVYQNYRPQVHDDMSEEALYRLLTGMLDELDDSHVGLLAVNTDLPQYQGGMGGRLDTIRDFHLPIVVENYLADAQESDPFTYGWLTDSTGYLHIAWEPGERSIHKQMPDIVSFFQSATGLVIDVRSNSGGEDRGGQAIASYFTDERRHYMTNRIKNGPGANDFTDPMEWYINPQEEALLQPLVLLTNRATVSAGETLVLAMRSLPQLTIVGDTTQGAFSNALPRELPNGWLYSISIGDWRAADGTSFEGRGIPPDTLVQNQSHDLATGTDQALEVALQLLPR